MCYFIPFTKEQVRSAQAKLDNERSQLQSRAARLQWILRRMHSSNSRNREIITLETLLQSATQSSNPAVHNNRHNPLFRLSTNQGGTIAPLLIVRVAVRL